MSSLQNLAKGCCCSLCLANEAVDPIHTNKAHVRNSGKYLDKLKYNKCKNRAAQNVSLQPGAQQPPAICK